MDNIRLVRRIRGAMMALVLLLPLGASAADPYPLEYFALRSAVSAVSVSPDGKHIAMLRILSREGDPILHIYDIDDLDGDPFVVNSDPMEITSYYWADDNYIVMTLRQRVRKMVKGQEDSVYAGRIAILDIVKDCLLYTSDAADEYQRV